MKRLLLSVGIVAMLGLACQPPPGVNTDSQQADSLERIATALEKLAEKECVCGSSAQ